MHQHILTNALTQQITKSQDSGAKVETEVIYHVMCCSKCHESTIYTSLLAQPHASERERELGTSFACMLLRNSHDTQNSDVCSSCKKNGSGEDEHTVLCLS